MQLFPKPMLDIIKLQTKWKIKDSKVEVLYHFTIQGRILRGYSITYPVHKPCGKDLNFLGS